MRLSTGRILTTHVGSLPRSQAVVDLLFRREQGEPYDPAEFDRVMAQAVAETVQRQAAIGIDVVSDGDRERRWWQGRARHLCGPAHAADRSPLAPPGGPHFIRQQR